MAKQKAITLRQLAALSGISYKSVQKAFDSPGAPARTRPAEELVTFLRSALPGTIKLPPDLEEQMIMLKFTTAQERKQFVIESKEEKRLKNLEKTGKLIERSEVRAQGAAAGMVLSSTLSGWVKDLPSELVGKSELEITRVLQGKVDRLISQIREKLKAPEKLKPSKSDE